MASLLEQFRKEMQPKWLDSYGQSISRGIRALLAEGKPVTLICCRKDDKDAMIASGSIESTCTKCGCSVFVTWEIADIVDKIERLCSRCMSGAHNGTSS